MEPDAPLVVDGEADRWAALNAVRASEHDLATAYLLHTLARNPRMWEAEDEPEFGILMVREEVRRVVQRARSALVADEVPPREDTEPGRDPAKLAFDWRTWIWRCARRF